MEKRALVKMRTLVYKKESPQETLFGIQGHSHSQKYPAILLLISMNVVMQKRDRVAWVTLDRAPLNVLNLTMLQELKAVLISVEGDTTVDILVLRGAGERAFSAGVDIKDHTREKVPEMLDTVHGVIRRLLALPQITIASVRGACLGGGCELASSCDFIFATEDSFFATPEINVGCYPPVALARFPGQLGYRRAAEMILTGRKVPAEEALAMGLITRVVPAHGRLITGSDIVRHRDIYQELFRTMIAYMNKGMGPEDAVKLNPLKQYEAEFGDPSVFLYGAYRSMLIAYVPD